MLDDVCWLDKIKTADVLVTRNFWILSDLANVHLMPIFYQPPYHNVPQTKSSVVTIAPYSPQYKNFVSVQLIVDEPAIRKGHGNFAPLNNLVSESPKKNPFAKEKLLSVGKDQ